MPKVVYSDRLVALSSSFSTDTKVSSALVPDSHDYSAMGYNYEDYSTLTMGMVFFYRAFFLFDRVSA